MKKLLVFVAVLAVVATGCTKQAQVPDPLRNVSLVPPYKSYDSGPTDRISVQYAVIEIAKQAGVEYDWDISYRNTDPVCREWLAPVINRASFPQAMDMILKPVNLTYTIVNGKIVLGRYTAPSR